MRYCAPSTKVTRAALAPFTHSIAKIRQGVGLQGRFGCRVDAIIEPSKLNATGAHRASFDIGRERK